MTIALPAAKVGFYLLVKNKGTNGRDGWVAFRIYRSYGHIEIRAETLVKVPPYLTPIV